MRTLTATECRNCGRAAQTFLCPRCVTELRDMLTGLAHGWIQYLEDAALGQTKLGESARRTPRYRRRLDGDKSVASQIELLPGEQWEVIEGPAREDGQWPLKVSVGAQCDLKHARYYRHQAALQHALGSARINLRASDQLEYTHSVLVEWCRDICETRGAEVPIANTVELASWLARHVSAIACDEGAAVCYREIQEIVRDIENVINRPERHSCGPCPSPVGDDQQLCSTALVARRGETYVHCWKCKATHNIGELIQRGLETVDELLYSARDVSTTMAAIGEPIPDRTWRQWRAEKKLVVRGWRGAEPMYWISDVRELLAQKPQKAPTGTAARPAGIL